MLHDLRKVNEVIEEMGLLQPGMPCPALLPRNWNIIIIDLKECFFTIPLHPQDAPKFAFSVPTVNKQAPMKRYLWVVLPQGMKNSPTMCQQFVDRALPKIREVYTTRCFSVKVHPKLWNCRLLSRSLRGGRKQRLLSYWSLFMLWGGD